jgi:hypothetical protein
MLRKLSVSQKPNPAPSSQPFPRIDSRTPSSYEADPDPEAQAQAAAEQDSAETTCNGHELKLERGVSMCDRHVANCAVGEGCKHDCGQCKRKRESRRVNRERLERSMLYHSEKQRDAGCPGDEAQAVGDRGMEEGLRGMEGMGIIGERVGGEESLGWS